MAVQIQRFELTAQDNSGAAFESMKARVRGLVTEFDSLRSMVDGMKSVLAVFGVSFSVSMVVEKINSVIDGMEKLQDASEKTGASVENLSKLQFFAGASGSSIDAVTQALAKLSKGMAVAGDDTGATSQALKTLGLTAKDSAGNLKDPAALFGEIAQKLALYQDGAGKAAIAQALFGKAGAEMLPTLKKMAELGDIDASVTTAQAAAAEAYRIELARLNQQKEILWNTLVGALLPTMQTFVGVLLDASKETDSLGAKAKTLAADGSITDWADASAMGAARLIDVLKTIPLLLDAISSSFKVVGADIDMTAKLATLMNPATAAAAAATGHNPLQEYKDALEERNRILADANAKYDALWNAEGNATEQRMAKAIADRKTADKALEDLAKNDAGFMDAMFGEDAKKQLNFHLGDETKAAAELKLYTSALQKYEEQLGRANGMSLVEKAIYELTEGSLKGLTRERKAAILAVAGEAQERLEMIAVLKLEGEAYDSLWKSQDALNRIQTAAAEADQNYLDDLKFQIDLIGKSVIAQQRMNEVHKIDLKLQADLKAAADAAGDNWTQFEKAYDDLTAKATGQKAVVLDSFASFTQVQRAWSTGTTIAFNDYIDHATNAAEMARTAFTAAFKSIEDTIYNVFRHGKLSAADFVSVLKDQLARLAAQQFTVSIVGSVGASMGMPGAGVASGVAGNALGLLSSGSNLIEGGAGLLGSAGAYSAITGGSMAAGSQAALLAAQTGEFGAAGLAATAGASAGMTALASAIPYVGLAVAAAGALGLFGGSDQPPPGQRYDNWANLQKNNGVFSIGSSEVPDPAAMTALARSIDAALNDPTKFDQAILDKLVGTSVSGGPGTGSQALIDALTQKLSPAADSAAKKISDLASATALASQRHQMEIVLMQAQGDAAGALAAKRKDELAALDPSLRALQQQIYAAEDLQNAATAASGAVSTLAEQLAKLITDVASAVDAQISASQSASQAARQSADAYRNAAATFRDTITQLRQGNLSPLNPLSKLQESGSTLDAIFKQALSGDSGALAKLPQTATDFLNASRGYNASSEAYTRDFDRVMTMLNQAGVASNAYAGVMDYQGTLLELQTESLKAIKEELAKPSPDAGILNEQRSLLATIGDLLVGQTQQLISVNSTLTDSRGQLIVGNALVSAQTGQIVAVGGSTVGQIVTSNALLDAQTGAVVSGNMTQDAIKSITDANKGISSSMLDTLLASAKTQSDYLTVVLTGTATTNTLLQQLIGNMDAQAYATWQAKFQADAATIWHAIEADASITNKLGAFDQQWAVWQAANPMPSHAAGLADVPYDNYQANLHAHEIVMDAPFAAGLRRYGIPINAPDTADSKQWREDQAKMARETLATTQEASGRQVAELRAGFGTLKEEFSALRTELRRLTA